MESVCSSITFIWLSYKHSSSASRRVAHAVKCDGELNNYCNTYQGNVHLSIQQYFMSRSALPFLYQNQRTKYILKFLWTINPTVDYNPYHLSCKRCGVESLLILDYLRSTIQRHDQCDKSSIVTIPDIYIYIYSKQDSCCDFGPLAHQS